MLIRSPRVLRSCFCLSLRSSHSLELKSQGQTVRFGHRWLRDHCRCSSCLNHSTYQRQVDITEHKDAFIVQIDHKDDDDQIELTWNDHHKSTFSKKWLLQLVETSQTSNYDPLLNYATWNRETFSSLESVPSVDYNEVMKGEGRTEWIDNILKWGFGLVKNCPILKEDATEDTRVIMERLGELTQTMYSDSVWSFLYKEDKKTNNLEYADTAYTNLGLQPHCDGSYFDQAPGLQFFQIPFHNGTGGETVIVDGFQIGNVMRARAPHLFDYLSSKPMQFSYYGGGMCLRNKIPVFSKVDDKLLRFTFNNDDRMPSYVSAAEEELHYQALELLIELLKDSSHQIKFALRPDWLLVTNNWRVLHGRTSFTGSRRLVGSYISMQNFLSTVRQLDPNSPPIEAFLIQDS